jgi:hypothetical protein
LLHFFYIFFEFFCPLTLVFQHSSCIYSICQYQVSGGPSWSWSYGSWIYNYMCNHLSCEFKTRSWLGVLDTTLCDKVCQWLATGWWFSTNKTDRHDITEILLKVTLNTIDKPRLSCIFTTLI